MKILVVGSGAREHTLCWKLKQSEKVAKLYCAPGNAGIGEIAEIVNIKIDNLEELTNFSVDNNIDLVVVGPEGPLVNGLVDMLMEKGIKAFGPMKKGARLEGSKSYSKDFMKKYNIPTAKYEVYEDSKLALEGLKCFDLPVVIKADGLAAGKGVLICETMEQAKQAINSIMNDKQFGEAGNLVVIEEFIDGIEASLLCFVDGKNIIPMESARDYKKAYDDDKGLNTGGMGNFSPNPIYTESLNDYINDKIIKTTFDGFIGEKIDFRGILFIGLMIKNGKAKVLEYNTRFGDPETESVIPRLKSDLVTIMLKCIEGNLSMDDLEWKEEKSVTVILASGGYPEKYEKGKVITGLELVDEDIIVFHGGTKLSKGQVVTDGGRVLAVTALGNSLDEAREKVYKNIPKIKFENMEYRKDIAKI
ncbi:MAG: phosphoribosylamine--glycine ligase [Sedimentibacter sp.]